MKFEWHSFKVEPYLEKGIQPEFMYKGINPSCEYCTMADPSTGKFTVTSTGGGSEAVRIPVFAVIADGNVQPSPTYQAEGEPTSHGSLLTCTGLEVASKLMQQLQARFDNYFARHINKIVVVMATNCHELENNRYRAYFGITVEVTK
tara:strand:+ start:1305 stop:1745 length:441 start_codon:yes stop_codon:yes gene_type:complete